MLNEFAFARYFLLLLTPESNPVSSNFTGLSVASLPRKIFQNSIMRNFFPKKDNLYYLKFLWISYLENCERRRISC